MPGFAAEPRAGRRALRAGRRAPTTRGGGAAGDRPRHRAVTPGPGPPDGGRLRAEHGQVVEEGTDGAAAATAFLAMLRDVAGIEDVRVSAMPFSGPSIPAMLRSGLAPELIRQRSTGGRLIGEILDVNPADSVARPPEGLMDQATLDHLALTGADRGARRRRRRRRAPEPGRARVRARPHGHGQPCSATRPCRSSSRTPARRVCSSARICSSIPSAPRRRCWVSSR